MNASDRIEPKRAVVYGDRLLRPFLVATFIAVVAAQLAESRASAAGLGWALFVPVALLTLWSLAPASWTPFALRVALLVVLALLSGALFSVPAGTFSAGFVYLAALSAGLLLESPRASIAVAVVAALSCALSSYVVEQTQPGSWPWWLGLTAGLPVYIGFARRLRAAALAAAQHAAAESERARASEAREAALIERGRIAREIHDVLGHSLSSISIQLDMADALQASGRADESMVAVRRARAMARSGIGETRRAVHALQEDPRPLGETIESIATGFGAAFVQSGSAAPVRTEAAQAVIRAAQEALTNAHRHAPGAPVSAVLRFGGDVDDRDEPPYVELTVVNGSAARASRPSDGRQGEAGMGLEGMRERASLLGGVVTAGPSTQAAAVGRSEHGVVGWTVTMRVPR